MDSNLYRDKILHRESLERNVEVQESNGRTEVIGQLPPCRPSSKRRTVPKSVPEQPALQHQCLSATPGAFNFSSHLTTIVCKAIR
jgi:hypothetical protein